MSASNCPTGPQMPKCSLGPRPNCAARAVRLALGLPGLGYEGLGASLGWITKDFGEAAGDEWGLISSADCTCQYRIG